MIDLILIFILAFVLYRSAIKHGLSPLAYVMNYITSSILASVIACCAFIHFYGISIFQVQPDVKITDPNVMPLLMFQMVSLAAEVALFFYLKWRIVHVQLQPADKDDRSTHDNSPPPPQKKDLSYFR